MNYKTLIGLVKLSKKRLSHITLRHPIMEEYLINIERVLDQPDEIRFSSYNDDVLLFYRFFDKIEAGKYIVVVVNKVEKEVKTAYLSHRIKIGRKYESKETF